MPHRGIFGSFLGAQLDLTTAAGEEYITFSVSYVKKGSSDVSRVALATRAFPGTHAADDIKPWIENMRRRLSWYVFWLFFLFHFSSFVCPLQVDIEASYYILLRIRVNCCCFVVFRSHLCCLVCFLIRS